MLESFLTFVNEHRLPLGQAPTLLAVSGGVDSMVMAELFRRAGFPFALAHCNFGLRGDESDADEQFVRQWAANTGVPCHLRRFDTGQVADDQGISIQMAARDLRYAWFDELLTGQSYPYLALAHHADDSIETVLLNLVRGTGLAGLLGIAPVRGSLIRPLLHTSKQAILDFARQQNILWREDSSNATDHYRRNVLRHRVLPVLQELNPAVVATFRHTTERLRAASHVLDSAIADWKNGALRQEGNTLYVSIERLQQTCEPAYYLHAVLEPFGYSYAQTLDIVAALEAPSGKQFFTHSHWLVKDRTELLVSPRADAAITWPIYIDETTQRIVLSENRVLHISYSDAQEAFNPISNKQTAYFDAALLRFPLRVRRWQPGDRFCPFGMHGKSKKVSDLLVESKIPLSHKEGCLVLTNADGRIIWVMGLRADNRFRVGPTTLRFVQMDYLPMPAP